MIGIDPAGAPPVVGVLAGVAATGGRTTEVGGLVTPELGGAPPEFGGLTPPELGGVTPELGGFGAPGVSILSSKNLPPAPTAAPVNALTIGLTLELVGLFVDVTVGRGAPDPLEVREGCTPGSDPPPTEGADPPPAVIGLTR